MSEIKVMGDLSPITDALKDIEIKVVPTAMRQGINKTLAGVRTDTRREIAAGLKIPQKEIKDSLSIRKATRGRFYEGSLVVGGSGKDVVPAGRSKLLKITKRKGITFKGRRIAGAFQLPGIRGGVFKRVAGNPRYKTTGNVKIRPFYLFTPAQQFTYEAQARVSVRVPGRMFKAFDAALANQLRRKGFR